MSDTHGLESLIKILYDIDIAIHSGDFSNYYDLFRNTIEMISFLNWYANIPIKYKVLIAGNHCAMAYCNGSEFRKLCEDRGIIFLENEMVIVMSMNNREALLRPPLDHGYFMKEKAQFNGFYSIVPSKTDIKVMLGPLKGILG